VSLGIGEFALQLMSGLIGWKDLEQTGGINLINSDIKTKKEYALNSIEFNKKKFNEINNLIENQYNEYKKDFISKNESLRPRERIKTFMNKVKLVYNPIKEYDNSIYDDY
jgi:hypothetical protein